MIVRRDLCRAAILGSLLISWGCGQADGVTEVPQEIAAAEDPVEIELSSLMGEMQRHSAKLGFAITGHNRLLATFYLKEIHEVIEELMTVDEHDGMPIAKPSGVILLPAIETLAAALSTEADWEEVTENYNVLITACNRCHLATEHGFIEILPATGEPPFNQRFEAVADS